MKKYVIPAIKIKDVDTESLMASLSKFDEVGEEGQFSKENMFNEEEVPQLPKASNVWDE